MEAAPPPGAAGRAAGDFCWPRPAAAARRSLTGSAGLRPRSPSLGTGRAGSCPCFTASEHQAGLQPLPAAGPPPERDGGVGPPACTHHRCPGLTNPGRTEPGAAEMLHGRPGLQEPQGGFPVLANGTAAPWPGLLPAMGFLGNASPVLCSVVISRGGSCCGCGSRASLPALGWGNAVPGEITGNREAEGCGRINPG